MNSTNKDKIIKINDDSFTHFITKIENELSAKQAYEFIVQQFIGTIKNKFAKYANSAPDIQYTYKLERQLYDLNISIEFIMHKVDVQIYPLIESSIPEDEEYKIFDAIKKDVEYLLSLMK